MGRQDYRNYQQPNKNNNEVLEEVVANGKVEDDLVTKKDEVINKPEGTNENHQLVELDLVGVIHNCSKLNVREKPSKRANVLEVLDSSQEVIVCANQLSNGWVKVKTNKGNIGYCMNDFIKTK